MSKPTAATSSTAALTAAKNHRDDAELAVAEAAKALRAAKLAYDAAVSAADAAGLEYREAFRAWFKSSLD